MQVRGVGDSDGSTPHPHGSFQLRIARCHQDLLPVSNALCPRTCPVC
ncbi:hypothetical protein ABIA33_002805 [Streptacidiphilus sp. MAP12-16]